MKVNVALVGAQPDEQAPQIALYSLNAAGQVQKKLATVEKGSVELPADLVKQKKPKMENLARIQGLRCRADQKMFSLHPGCGRSQAERSWPAAVLAL